MRRMDRRERKQKKKIIIFSCALLICLLSVGYAAFSTNFIVNGKGTIISNKKLAAEALKENVVNSGDGLYKDSYESGRYIYKGASPSNYITYNNETWRIISVEADGTLKIIRNESIGQMVWDISGSNDWSRPATLNTYLNSDYYNSLTTEAKGLIQSHTWGVGAVTWGNTDLAGQITSENSKTWTGNIALISVSDYLRANTNTEQCGNLSINNTNTSTCKTTKWIYNVVPSGGWLWTVSPLSDDPNYVFSVSAFSVNAGYVIDDTAYNDSFAAVPALYLKSNITLEGEGTIGSPYTIIQN